MVKRRRVSKKLFYETSEVQTPVSLSLPEFIQKNFFPLIIGSVSILLLMLGFFVWKYVNNKKEEKASILFYQAYNVYQKSKKEEKTMEEPLQLFQSLARKYSGTSAGMLSLFYLGNCQYSMKSFDDAITSYNKFLQDVHSEARLRLLAYDSLGYCYEEKNDLKKAIEYFQKTISPPPGLGESGYLNIARCYETLNDKKNGLKVYKKFLLEYPDSEKIHFVREKIRMLESKN